MNLQYRDICPYDECTGCMACLNACNHNAVEIQTDSLGFKYPKINTDRCTECGLCIKICPQNNHRQFTHPAKCYAAALQNKGSLITCASGGVATALSIYVLKSGGIVVGCTGEDIYNVEHIIVEKMEDLQKLKGSKYVQSSISKVLFRQIILYLKEGRNVLFFGTGCQTAGLQSFLVKQYDNLITVDLVCHGVPSQKLLSEDLSYYGNIARSSVSFRCKTNRRPYIKYLFSADTIYGGKTISKIWYKEPYLGSFISGVSFRKSCYNCQYAQPMRQSDITLCDFWGLGRDSQLSDSKGVSAVLISTYKGQNLFDSASYLLEIEERNVEEAIKGNGQLQRPSKMPSFRMKFQSIYIESGIRKAYIQTAYKPMRKKYLRQQIPTFIYKLYAMLRKLLHK